jgi:phospholipase C
MVSAMIDPSGMSRREFLGAATSVAALLALEGCSGKSTPGAASATTTTATTTATSRVARPHLAGERPDPTRPEGSDLVPQIEHIVVVMQENHSYDSYFGMLRRGDGFTVDAGGRPTASNPDARGNPVRAFHMANTCQAGSPSQNWNSSHIQWNSGAMDGFVRSPSGAAAMGYWDGADLPFYYGLAETFPLCDRWFASCLGQTYPNRRFLLCGSALGSIDTIGQTDLPAPANGTIVETLNRHGISWRDYYTTLPSLALFLPVFVANQDKCPKIDQFFTDAAAGELPSVCLVESNSQTQTEEAPQDISLGEAFTAKVVNAVMQSPSWPRTVLVLCYDEHGGYYDHVPPPVAVVPDDIAPILRVLPGENLDGLAGNVSGNYARYGLRVPAVIVSPYARKSYVSHVTHDHTSILSLIEHKWNLSALTNRDGAADNLLDSLDFSGPPPFLEPPTLPAPKNNTGAPICTRGQPGPIPNSQN